jgi:uncharacterized protein YndB with AHSA1/START domain
VPRLTVRTVLPAPPEEVWADISDLASHVEWMHDAHSIEFTSERTSGTGTTFDCETRVGPLRTTDRMRITRWEPARRMGVEHVGLVRGTGEFTLRRTRGRGPTHTRFVWRERLRFPWFLGGPIGALVARPVLRWVWRRNLRNLRARFE